MDKKQKFNVGDTAYYLGYRSIIHIGTINGVDQRKSGSGICFTYYIGSSKFSESELFSKKSEAFMEAIHEVLSNFHMDEEKVEFICKTLFPDEYQEENGNELTDEDFEKLEKPEEPLQIPEKSSFFRNLFK